MFNTLEKLALFLAILGVGIAGYLTYSSVIGGQVVCGLSSCGVVNSSEYSKFLGIPVSILGLAFYLSLIVLLFLKQKKLFFLATLVGVIFSAYLTYLEAFVIHAWCQWCILSAWISASLFIIAFRLKEPGQNSANK